ncbi:AAA family ATPase [uncultured Roseibium sp.]|uniref:AAA family ATPase n=1 Tax=uncultured Roseibium sp. TaxID=1936171 RepID=UPI00262F563E|nr:AAA family ATPase [uncultured Roseibium sp.]
MSRKPGKNKGKAQSSLTPDETTSPTSGTIPLRSELSVVVFGINTAGPTHFQLTDATHEMLFAKLGSICAATASEFGGKLVNLPSGQKVLVFGVPVLKELDAERAVLAAQKILRIFKNDGSTFQVQLRCGIASGVGFVVPSDGPSLSPQDVSGKVFDEASLLEKNACGNTLLVSGNTRSLFRSNFEYRQVQLSDGAGIAYEVLQSIAPPSTTLPNARDKTLSAFAGRTNELKSLRLNWSAVKDKKPQLILIEGDPGIGKSRLIHTFLQKAGSDQALVLNFSGSVHHRRTPFFPVAQGLYSFLGLKGLQSPSLIGSVIQTLLVDLKLDTPRNNANLRAILKSGGLDSHPPREKISAEAPLQTLKDCFCQLSLIHPVVLVFEDAHWMDSSSLELIAYLADTLTKDRILTLVSTRPDPGASELADLADRTCRMQQLTREQTRFLASQLRPRDMTDAHFEHVIRKSDGIPLFLEELMNIAIDRGGDFFEERRETLIPASLRETLAARISHLGNDKELLLMASAIGGKFDQKLLTDIAGLAGKTVKKHLSAFQKSGLIFPSEEEEQQYEFKHGLVQDLAYQSIGPKVRKEFHARIASALTRDPENQPEVAAEVIAHHFEQAGNVAASLDYLEIAGLQAVRLAAHKDAGKHFKKALELARGIEGHQKRDNTISRFLLLLGPQMITNHGFASEEVQEVYSKARMLKRPQDRSSENLQMIWGLWGAHMVRADISFALELSADFLEIALQLQTALELAAGHYMTGVGAFYVGDLKGAERAFLAAVSDAERADFEDMVTNYSLDLGILARSYLCWCYALTNQPEKMQTVSDELERLASDSDHAFCQAFSSCFLATANNFCGKSEAAQRHALKAMELCGNQDFAQQAAQAAINLGRARFKSGDTSALPLMEKGLEDYLSTGAILARPYAEAWIAEALLQKNDAKGALIRLNDVKRFTDTTGEAYFDAELTRLSAVATAKLHSAEHPQVRKLLEASVSMAKQTGAELHLNTATALLQAQPALKNPDKI